MPALRVQNEVLTVLLKDMVEGETNLFETVDRILLQIAADGANLIGLDKAISTMEVRKKRIEGRAETMRTMLASALEILEQKRFERPLATVTLKPTPRKVLITNEAAIPSIYWKRADPTVSKKDLADALKAHEETRATWTASSMLLRRWRAASSILRAYPWISTPTATSR